MQPDTTPIIQYLRRETIARSSALPTVADEPASPVRDVSEGEACPTASGFIADQDRATIAKSSTLPHDSASREEIGRLKARVQVLEDIDVVATKQFREDAPIKGRSNNEGEAAAERISNDSEEIARVLTSIDAATVLAGEIDVPNGSGFILTAGPPATIISTNSEVGPTASPIVTRRKEQVKKQKSSEEAPKIETTTKEFLEEKIKEMMQLVPVKDVYVQALQVKHPIIDWKVHSEGQRSYWQIIRLGGSSACYQFFVDLLRQLDREDLNQLWALVKEYLSIRPASSDKEIELWIELKRMYEPDLEDQL
nr:hypothetical protein [Tanacetum cinerariifolium]